MNDEIIPLTSLVTINGVTWSVPQLLTLTVTDSVIAPLIYGYTYRFTTTDLLTQSLTWSWKNSLT